MLRFVGYPKQLTYVWRSQSSPNRIIFHFYITPVEIKFFAYNFYVKISWKRWGYNCKSFVNFTIDFIGYKNWFGLICLNRVINYVYAYLEPSATVEEAPHTAPHPIFYSPISYIIIKKLYYHKNDYV